VAKVNIDLMPEGRKREGSSEMKWEMQEVRVMKQKNIPLEDAVTR